MQTQNYKLRVYVKIEKYWKLLQPFMDAFLKLKKLFLKEGFVFFSFFMYTLSMAAKRASKSSSVVEHFTCSNGFTPASK